MKIVSTLFVLFSALISVHGANLFREMKGERDLKTLTYLLRRAGLAKTVAREGPFTIFAPEDSGFEALFSAVPDLEKNLLKKYNKDILTNVLLHHVVSGKVESGDLPSDATLSATTLNGEAIDITVADLTVVSAAGATANLVDVDIDASNGVIHTTSGVLVPNGLPSDYITQLAVDNDLSILVAALQATGLDERFAKASSCGYTVFAPTNVAFEAAFEALGITAEELLANTELLTTILKYHVAYGVKDAEYISGRENIWTMLKGQAVTVEVSGDTVKIDDATVIAADVRAWNGIVHVIDAVLVPEL